MHVEDRLPQREPTGADVTSDPAEAAPRPRDIPARPHLGDAWAAALRRWDDFARSMAQRPLLALGLLGLASLIACILQAGMSERLRLTWRLANQLDRAVSATMPGAGLFRAAVSWVPRRLPAPLPGAAGPDSPFLMAMLGYVGAVGLLFALYALTLRWVARHPVAAELRPRMLLLVGGAGALLSTVLLFTAAVPSHDAFAYATGGRLLATYHANPFFVVPSAYPRDPILAANEWPVSTIAYGPLWALLSLLLNPLVGADPLRADMVYRLVAYVAQLANIVLVAALLRRLPLRHQVWQERGLLLYAWNPLVLVEVAAGHNDVLMLTLVLLGLYLLVRGQQYPAMVSLGAAILVKASAAPLVLLILLALWLAARPATRRRAWARALGPAVAVGGVVLVGYLPFFWGHSPAQIATAARLHPNTQSLARALTSSFGTLSHGIAGSRVLPAPLASALAHGALVLASPTFWTLVLALAMLATTFFLLPALRHAEQVPAALAWVYAVWMVFLSIFLLLRTWYLIPLVGLVALTPAGRPIRRFVLLLTASMQLTSLFLSQAPPFGGWQAWTWPIVVGIPLVALILDLRREGFDWRAAAWRRAAVLRESLGWPATLHGAPASRVLPHTTAHEP
jgi:hypothetical protein